MEIISQILMKYWRRIVLSVFIIEIFKRWLLKYSNFWMDCPHKSWMKSSRLNRQSHTIWVIKMNYIVEIPKLWRMGLSQSRLWHLKSGQPNQTVHVGYAKPTCDMLVLYNKHLWYWNKNIFLFCYIYVI